MHNAISIHLSDIRAGEAIFLDMHTGECHSHVCIPEAKPSPCIFEYVYFGRPDSIMDGISVYETRLKMGEKLAEKILRKYWYPNHDIDVAIPIPDTSRTSALQAAYPLNCPFREFHQKLIHCTRLHHARARNMRKVGPSQVQYHQVRIFWKEWLVG